MKSESGRSMVEMIAVIGIVIVLTMGALTGYKQVVASHQAISLHEDILVQAQAQKGHNYRDKSIYDSGIGKKTRMGLRMDAARAENGDTFSIVVQNVATDTCSYLIKKDWKDAVRIKINNLIYTPKNIECVSIKESGQENFTFEVIFPKTKASVSAFERTCDQCMSCERCDSTMNICVNACPDSAQFCQNNRCVFSHCPEGQNLDNGECVACVAGYACSSCAEISNTKLLWDGEKCVCSDDTCGKGHFCNTSGECDWCPENATCEEGFIVCDENYYQVGESCVLCPQNATCEDNGNIIPNPGYYMAEGEIQSCTNDICEGCQLVDSTKPYWNPTNQECVRLPIEYQEVEYLKGNGNGTTSGSYIDTGIKATQNTCVEIDDYRTRGGNNSALGANPYISITNTGGTRRARWNNNTWDGAGYLSTRQVTKLDKGKLYINNVLKVTFTQGTFISADNIYLFARSNNTGGIEESSDAVIYYCKIWDNDVLLRDFVPVIHKSDNVAGMYDLVSKTFFTNVGTKEFIAGPPVAGSYM